MWLGNITMWTQYTDSTGANVVHDEINLRQISFNDNTETIV